MEALASWMQPFFAWLVQTTWMASILICLILAAQKLLGGRLGARWCHALWMVLLIRMALPWAPPSPVSLFNLIPATIATMPRQDDRGGPVREDSPSPAATVDAGPTATVPASNPPEATGVPVVSGLEKSAVAPSSASAILPALRQVLPVLWGVGAMVLGGYLLASNFALWRIVRRDHPVTNQPMLELFEECKSQMGVQTLVALVPNDQVRSAALFGFLRPRLLLPQQMLETASRNELRYVFLHELAHLKRGDIYLGWLTSLLQVLHWFNPLIWFAFHRMRADRELACDALVLTRTGGDESYAYGRTMVGLLSRFSRSRHLPALAGILESKSQLKRRIAMIARFQANSYRWSPAAIVTVLAVACLALPGARKSAATATEKPAGLSTAPAPTQGATFRRIRIPNRIPLDAQLSPDGKSIALVLEDKLWVMPRTGKLGPDYPGVPTLVDTGGQKVESGGLTWSRDGRWLAFNETDTIQGDKREGRLRIYVIPVVGGVPKKVYETSRDLHVQICHLSLSPEGKTLAFSSVEGDAFRICTIPADGGQPRRLVEAPAREPVFSPDGKMIAYVEDRFLGREGGALWVVPAQGGTPQRVADAGHATSPVWSPDGRWIAFLDWGAPKRQVCLVPLGERGEPAGEKTAIDWPGGGMIVRLAGWTPENHIGAVRLGRQERGLYTLALPHGRPTLVARGGTPLRPRWSPDGKRIVYSIGWNSSGGGWLNFGTAWVPAEGGEATLVPIESETRLTKQSGNNVSPDGRTIVFSGGEDRASHIWTHPLQGGKPIQLTNAPPPLGDWFPCWSPDGEAIAFVHVKLPKVMARSPQEVNIHIVPAEGGESRQLTSESDAVAFAPIAWSPDGKLIAYQSADKDDSPDGIALRVIPLAGGKPRVVGRMQGRSGMNTELAWSPDSRRIALNADQKIKILSLDDGSTVDITPDLANNGIYHLDWSRDGERLVFAGYERGDTEFWLMENFLPRQAGK
jgi:Tol biopolymer transport system component/beta-lactamase regulating signal transducer with metallopeptidase domain